MKKNIIIAFLTVVNQVYSTSSLDLEHWLLGVDIQCPTPNVEPAGRQEGKQAGVEVLLD